MSAPEDQDGATSGRPLTDQEIRDLEERIGIPANWHKCTRALREAWLLRHSKSPPVSHRLIGERLGVGSNVVSRRLGRAKEILGADPDTGALAQQRTPGLGERGDVAPQDLAALVEQKLWDVASAIDADRIGDAKLRDLVAGVRDLNTVRAQLRQEPTSIVKHEGDREDLGVVIENLWAVMRRRGITAHLDPGRREIVVEGEARTRDLVEAGD